MNDDTRATLFQAEHERESNLINHRVSWLLASQSFLFALMGFLLISRNDMPLCAKSLLAILPWLGLTITVCLILGMIGAYIALGKMERLEYASEVSMVRCKGKFPRVFGIIGSLGTAKAFLAVWLIILLSSPL